MSALLDGDSAERQRHFQMMAGLHSDTPNQTLGQKGTDLTTAELDSLLQMLGKHRTDVFRNKNASFLLGNYPAALSRAGYESYMAANAAAAIDSVAYHDHLARSLVAFEASLIVEPFNQQALEFYPLLLVQAYHDQKAMDFLFSLSGQIEVEVEERTVYNALRGFVRGGVPDLAFAWLDLAVDNEPERRFYYQLEFALYQEMGRLEDAREVMSAWETVSGEIDPEMQRGIDALQEDALQREQQRIDDAVEGGQSNED
jgi:tetratricopeptide (TPR) repeat protein